MTGNPDTSFDPTSLMQGWMKAATENWQETARKLLDASQGKAAPEFPGTDISDGCSGNRASEEDSSPERTSHPRWG